MNCHSLEDTCRPHVKVPRYRLLTRQAINTYRILYSRQCDSVTRPSNAYIVAAIRAVKQPYREYNIDMMASLNTNLNHNDAQVKQIYNRYKFVEPSKNYIRKDILKRKLIQRIETQDVKVATIKDKCISRSSQNNTNIFFNDSPFPENSRSKQSSKTLKKLEIKPIKSSRNRTTSNNADNNFTRRFTRKNNLNTLGIQCQKQNFDVFSNYKNNNEAKIKEKTKRFSSICASKTYPEEKINDKQKNNICMICSMKYKTKVFDSEPLKPISNLTIKSTSCIPIKLNPDKCELKLKRNERKFMRKHGNEKFDTIMDCVKEISGRLNSKNDYLNQTYQIAPYTIERQYTIGELVHYSTFLNHTLKELNPFKVEKALKTISGEKEESSIIDCISLLYMTMTPVSVRLHFRLHFFNVYQENVITTLTQMNYSLFIQHIHTLESTITLFVHKYRSIILKVLTHQEDLYENLSRLINNKINIIDTNLLCWNHPVDDSWDEISETNSNSSVGVVYTDDYRNISSDCLCNTEDIYGSEIDIEDLQISENNLKSIHHNNSDMELRNKPEKNLQLDFSELKFMEKHSHDESWITTCELSMEMFTIKEEKAMESFSLSSYLTSLVSTTPAIIIKLRIKEKTPYNCPCLRQKVESKQNENVITTLKSFYPSKESIMKQYVEHLPSFSRKVLNLEACGDTVVYYPRLLHAPPVTLLC